MSRPPSRQAVLAVRAVKAAATTAVAGAAIVLTLGGATATPGGLAVARRSGRPGRGRAPRRALCGRARSRPSCGPLTARPGRSRSSTAGRSTGASVRGPWSWSARLTGLTPRVGPTLTRTARHPRARHRPATGCRARARPGARRPRSDLPARAPRAGRCADTPAAARRARGPAPLPGARASTRRDQPVDQPHGVRLGRPDRPAGEDQVQGPPGADEPRQPHRAARR